MISEYLISSACLICPGISLLNLAGRRGLGLYMKPEEGVLKQRAIVQLGGEELLSHTAHGAVGVQMEDNPGAKSSRLLTCSGLY